MICPSRIIEMQQDKEGFLYPAVQKNKCVSCGLCVNVCPVITGKEKQNKKQGTLGFILLHFNYTTRTNHTTCGTPTTVL